MNARYAYIDSLRAFAFLGVLTIHVGQQVKSIPFRSIVASGKYGVQLFFLLSAITLLVSLDHRAKKEVHYLRNFFIRRLFRIGPLFWLGILIYGMLDGFDPRFWAPNGISWWHFISTGLFMHGWQVTTLNAIVPGGWSIAVEATFYMCLPFIFNRIKSFYGMVSLGFYSLLLSSILNLILSAWLKNVMQSSEQLLISDYLYMWFPSQLPVFCIGMAIYHVLRNQVLTDWLSQSGRPFFIFLVGVYGFVGLTHLSEGWLVPVHIWFSFALAFIVVAFAIRPPAIFVNRLVCNLGKISYSCYIVHFLSIKMAVLILQSRNFGDYLQELNPIYYFLTIWFIALAITVFFSSITYLLIEKPGVNLGKMLIHRLDVR